MQRTHRFLLVFIVLSLVRSGWGATLRVGDVASDLSFVARQEFMTLSGKKVLPGEKVQITDFAGSVVFLEWFAVWCPFCVAAAPQVDLQIAKHYQSRGGNPAGVPVVHVAVNQEARSFYQVSTDQFVARHGFSMTVNDYDGSSVNRERFKFQTGGQPIFVVISALTNSPTHKPYEVLVNHLGYGDTDFAQELGDFRSRIDQVKPAAVAVQPAVLSAPALRSDGAFEFKIEGMAGRSYRVESSNDLEQWTTVETIVSTGSAHLFKDGRPLGERRYYRVTAEP